MAFSEARVDRAIIETGLGGRLDASRLCNADLCAITTISKEHTEILGDSLEEIAREKSGIYRKGVPLFCIYNENKKVRDIFEEVAGSDLRWFKSKSKSFEISSEYASLISKSLGWKPHFSELNWIGRTETNFPWSSEVKSKISAAHNSESFQNDISQLNSHKKILLIGMSRKTNLRTHLSAFHSHKYFESVIVTEVSAGRNPTVPADELENEIPKVFDNYVKIYKIINPIEAMDFAIKIALKEGYEIFITGSIYLIGELLREYIDRNSLDFDDIMKIHPPEKPNDDYPDTPSVYMSDKWDLRFLELARHISDWSKDPSTKVGCVVVGPDREIRSTGFNGFPRGIEDDDNRLQNRKKISYDLSRRRECYHACSKDWNFTKR